jgi:hypothetical protein
MAAAVLVASLLLAIDTAVLVAQLTPRQRTTTPSAPLPSIGRNAPLLLPLLRPLSLLEEACNQHDEHDHQHCDY